MYIHELRGLESSTLGARISTYVYVHTYMCRERPYDGKLCMYVCMYVYMYVKEHVRRTSL